ncbi:MAG TPA: hypothetical protein EYP55_06865 [Anaerolineae bacterium]|nr:hypothetical protein [Anaerolineae bacterium]
MKRRKGILWPIILIATGVLFLLGNLGLLQWDAWELLRFWPLILVLIGLDILASQLESPWAYAATMLLGLVVILGVIGVLLLGARLGPARAVETQQIAEPLGEIREAHVEIHFSGGDLTVGPLHEPANLLEGRFQGPSGRGAQVVEEFDAERGRLTLRSPRRGFFFVPLGGPVPDRWDLALTTRVPLTLIVNTGVGETLLDLEDLQVLELELDAGVGRTTVVFPARGRTRASVNGGVGELRLEIPRGVEARIEVDTGIGSLNVDRSRFPQAGEDLYMSEEYYSAEDRLDLRVDVGMGSVTIQ